MSDDASSAPRKPFSDDLPPPDFVDPVIEAYKKDIDRTLLIENLKLTPEQRLQKGLAMLRVALELRAAGERFRQQEQQHGGAAST